MIFQDKQKSKKINCSLDHVHSCIFLRFLNSPSGTLIINKTEWRAVLFIVRVPEGLVKKRKKRRNGRDLGYNLFFGTFVCLEKSYLLDGRHSEKMEGFHLAELP